VLQEQSPFNDVKIKIEPKLPPISPEPLPKDLLGMLNRAQNLTPGQRQEVQNFDAIMTYSPKTTVVSETVRELSFESTRVMLSPESKLQDRFPYIDKQSTTRS